MILVSLASQETWPPSSHGLFAKVSDGLALMTYSGPNEFRVFAHGEDFDVDAYLRTSTLHPDRVWRRRSGGIQTNGVVFDLGDGRSIGILDQERIAIKFLKEHTDALRTLGHYAGVETFILGLQRVCKVAEPHDGFCLSPSQELLWHTLDIGVQLVFYGSFDRTKEASPIATRAVDRFGRRSRKADKRERAF